MCLLLERGMDQGYFTNTEKFLYISNIPTQEEEAWAAFKVEELALYFVTGNHYIGAYLGTRERMYASVRMQVEYWYRVV